MVISPISGFIIAFLCIKTLKTLCKESYPRLFRSLQICSASSIGFMHGLNDAQKTMGVITLCLAIATTQQLIPPFAEWLTVDATAPHVPVWVKMLCALTMALGTAVGGWKIIKTMGFKIVKLSSREGFVAETASASTVGICSLFGMPVSTTHNITASIVGAGSAANAEKVSYKVIYRILIAWVLTFPCAGILGALFESLLNTLLRQ
jgi:PiT family inorganic phosphate transporter